ncbi:MAG: NfeD family protein [Spirulina sp. SIO3F2]|nr:NfeD family protein [Spirulina sp. SIO3F2]
MSNPTLLWLMAGGILCLMEFFFPTALVEFTMGLAALIVGLVSFVVPSVGFQIALWMILSVIFILAVRRWFTPKTRPVIWDEAPTGETLTEILPGQAGRVLCDGNSWRAFGEDDTVAIPAGQQVEIIRRDGNTLIVRLVVKTAAQF